MRKKKWMFKIILTGNPSVGKTSLRKAYLGEKFSEKYLVTIGVDFSLKHIELEDIIIDINIWDLAGQPEFSNIHPRYYLHARGNLIVYDVTDRNSFYDLKFWIEKFIRLSGNPVAPILIIGNKIDLIHEKDDIVTLEEHDAYIEELQKNYTSVPILSARTSAKTGENVNSSFEKLIKVIVYQIEHGTKGKISKTPEKDNFNKYLPASYLLWMNEITGPEIIARSPMLLIDPSDKELVSSLKLVSTIDFSEITKNFEVGFFPWQDPTGDFYYVAFALDNHQARGGKTLFVIGLVTHSQLQGVIASKFHSMINGFLINSMNRFANLYNEQYLDKSSFDEKTTQIFSQRILLPLRKKVYQLFTNSLSL